jgi:pimeloyl-ACP methyl ester carboxylesterase
MPDIQESAFVKRIEVEDATLACRIVGEGPLILLAHGFPDCWRTFRHQEPELVASGYRVASLSMRAYAPSTPSRRARYDALTLGSDLLAVGRELCPEEPFTIVGHDWGAVAAYAAVAREPSRVRALVTAAVPHLGASARGFFTVPQLRRSWYMWFFQLPGVAERRLMANDLAFVERLWRDWSPGYRCPQAEMVQIKEAIAPHHRGVLAYYRSLLSRRTLSPSRLGRMLKKTSVPSLYLHGREDGCVGPELVRDLESVYSGPFESHILDGCGHFLHLERPGIFNRALLAFLSKHVSVRRP